MSRLVLSLFDASGRMARPWAEAGYETLCVDIQHKVRTPSPSTLHCDLRTVGPLLMALAGRGYTPADIVFLSCFPPCTDVAVSGARDFRGKGLRRLAASIEQFATCQEMAALVGCPWMIENPISAIATHWRKPDHYFHPWQYAGLEPADHYTKKTCLWVGGGFAMPAPCPVVDTGAPDDRIHKAQPGAGRADFRSATPEGFARAVFGANAGLREVAS